MQPSSDDGQAVARLDELREARQRCARRFGEAKRQGADLAPLKAEMQSITQEIDEIERRLREVQNPKADPQAPAGQDNAPQRFTYRPPNDVAPAGLRVAAASDDGGWDSYAATHPAASPYHFAAWRRLVCEVMGHKDASIEARTADGRIVGILPMVHMQSRLFGQFLVSMPYFNYGGALADSTGIESALLTEAGSSVARLCVQHAEIREMHQRQNLPCRSNKVSMLRALPQSDAELDRQLGSKLRAQVQRARREAHDLRIGRQELLDDFYTVFARNMRDLGTPVYAKRLFSAVLEAWPERSRIVVLRMGGRPVAAGFLVGHGDVLEIPWASTLRSVNHLGVNMLLYRSILAHAIESGYRWFDFGRSTEDAGTFRFKRQWGAEPVRHYWHYCLPGGATLPGLNPDNPKFRLLIATWRLLPVWVTRVIGPAVVRGIP